jgi:site-specific DNA-adenine methylase
VPLITAARAPNQNALERHLQTELKMTLKMASKVFIKNTPEDVIQAAPMVQWVGGKRSLFYMDPPYFGTEGYGVEFGLEQYDQMAELIGTMKGKAVVSVNDIPEMRKAFKGHHIKRVRIRYTVGASGRGVGAL